MAGQNQAQKLFDRLEALKEDRAAKVRERKEGLMAIPRYVEVSEEQKKLRDQKKHVIAEFDEQNGGLKEEIDTLDRKISETNFSLTTKLLESLRDGESTELTKVLRSGKTRKMVVDFVARFNQLTLFEQE